MIRVFTFLLPYSCLVLNPEIEPVRLLQGDYFSRWIGAKVNISIQVQGFHARVIGLNIELLDHVYPPGLYRDVIIGESVSQNLCYTYITLPPGINKAIRDITYTIRLNFKNPR